MKPQQGATLLVVLVMLVVITLLGIASIRISGSNLLVVGNMQSRKFVENYGLQAIEQVLNSIAPFNAPTSAVAVAAPAGLTVSVSNRTCTFSAPAPGTSAVSTIAPEDNNWEFSVTVTDSFTGARTSMVQGVKIRQLAGACS
jgi:Tfp pilus assembly protein PilX